MNEINPFRLLFRSLEQIISQDVTMVGTDKNCHEEITQKGGRRKE